MFASLTCWGVVKETTHQQGERSSSRKQERKRLYSDSSFRREGDAASEAAFADGESKRAGTRSA